MILGYPNIHLAKQTNTAKVTTRPNAEEIEAEFSVDVIAPFSPPEFDPLINPFSPRIPHP